MKKVKPVSKHKSVSKNNGGNKAEAAFVHAVEYALDLSQSNAVQSRMVKDYAEMNKLSLQAAKFFLYACCCLYQLSIGKSTTAYHRFVKSVFPDLSSVTADICLVI